VIYGVEILGVRIPNLAEKLRLEAPVGPRLACFANRGRPMVVVEADAVDELRT
jgi:hypothetical protein